MVIATTSRQYVHVDIGNTLPDGATATIVDPQMAFLMGDANPGPDDWHTAEQLDGVARVLVGPDGGTLTLTPGRWWVWVTWISGAEQPVQRAGYVQVY